MVDTVRGVPSLFVAIRVQGGAAVIEQDVIGRGRVVLMVMDSISQRPGGLDPLHYAKGLARMLSVHYGVMGHMPKTFTPGHK